MTVIFYLNFIIKFFLKKILRSDFYLVERMDEK